MPWSDESSRTGKRKADGSQRISDDFQSTTPIVRHLEPIRDRRQPKGVNVSRSQASLDSSHHQLLRQGISNEEHHSRLEKGKRRLGSLRGDADSLTKEMLESKRQDLLKRSDWLSASTLRPLKMDFPSIADRERVGKRRRLTEDDLHRGEGILIPRRRIVDGPQTYNQRLTPIHDELDQQISVRVGSSIHGSQRTHDQPSVSNQDQGSRASDGMLFDLHVHNVLSDGMLLDSPDAHNMRGCKSKNSMYVNDRTEAIQLKSPITGGSVHVRDRSLNQTPVTFTKNPVPRHKDNEVPHVSDTERREQASADRPDQDTEISHDHVPGILPNVSSIRLISRSTPPQFRGQDDNARKSRDSDQSILAEASQGSGSKANDSTDEIWKAFVNLPESSVCPEGISESAVASTRSGDLIASKNTTKSENNKSERLTRDDLFMEQSKSISASAISCFKVEQQLLGGRQPTQSPEQADLKDKFETEDANSAWYRFVFGFKEGEDIDENGNPCWTMPTDYAGEDEMINASMDGNVSEDSAVTPVRSLPSGTANSLDVQPATSSPDPLALSVSPSTLSRPNKPAGPVQPKVVFKKPLPFVGRRFTNTLRIGENLSSSPIAPEADLKRRKNRTTRRRKSEMKWTKRSSDAEDEDIED